MYRLLIYFFLAIFFIGTAQSQPCSGAIGKNEGGIWVVYGGKDQFQLRKARRIPAGESVSLRGYPLPKELPEVMIRNRETGNLINLEVRAEPACNSWITAVPSLKPNTKTEIAIRQFHSLTDRDKEEVKEVFTQMLLNFSYAANTGVIPSEGLAAERAQAIEEYLKNIFPPDKTLIEYVSVREENSKQNTLGAELINLIGLQGVSNLSIRNVVSDYLDGLRNLNELVSGHLEIAEIPDRTKITISDFWRQLPPGLFKPDSVEIAAIWMEEVLARDLLPISANIADALNKFVTATNREEYRDFIAILSTPLEKRFPDLFNSLRRIETEVFTPETLTIPLITADLLRYGTIDFVQGFVTGIKEPRGFLVFSFFPTGPQERTPNDIFEGRLALSIGYSVTGGGANAKDFFIGGLILRTNRFISITGGGVVPNDGKGPSFGFIGIAGDVSAIPFLDDIFTTKP